MSQYKTRRGVSLFSALRKTDVFRGQPTDQYKAKVFLTDKAAEHFEAAVEAFKSEEMKPKDAKNAASPGKPYTDRDDNEGILVVASSKYAPLLVDSMGTELDPEVDPGNGSVIRVAGKFYVNGKGNVGFQLKAVQVLKIVEGASNPFAGEDDDEEDEDEDRAAHNGKNAGSRPAALDDDIPFAPEFR